MSSSGTSNPVRRLINWPANHPLVRLITWAAITIVTYLIIGSNLHDVLPFFWAWNRPAGRISAWVSAAWPIFAIAIVATILIGIFRVWRNKPRRPSPEFGGWLLVRSGYEEITRWMVGTFWMVVITNFPTIFHWLFATWTVPMVNYSTFGLLSSHAGSHDWMFAAAAILSAVRIWRTPSFGTSADRFSGWYIGVLMFGVMMSFGIFVAVAVRTALYFGVIATRRLMDSRQAPAPAPTPAP